MRQEKQLLIDEIQTHCDKHNATFVILSYQGLNANAANQFRREIGKMGGSVEMMRKRILQKAMAQKGIELPIDSLPGHIGVVFSGGDPIETTKFVFKFSQENNKAIKVVGGRFDGLQYSGEDVEKLSKLPSKDEMRAQLLATFEAPMSQTLAVMEALLTSVVYCLDNKCKEQVEGERTAGES